jgi:hypothetical protein
MDVAPGPFDFRFHAAPSPLRGSALANCITSAPPGPGRIYETRRPRATARALERPAGDATGLTFPHLSSVRCAPIVKFDARANQARRSGIEGAPGP